MCQTTGRILCNQFYKYKTVSNIFIIIHSNLLLTLKGLAAGTLLYVTVCEVLPRERARWHNQTTFSVASLIQFTAVAAGFGIMTIITHYLGMNILQ